jgi:4-amino-4-deoxy-L-arabinose transferase-like glycosyltransferase
MNRSVALLLLVLFWAGLYLPGLDKSELQGEEARRILPGVAMLETGNWILPELNGRPYFRKPPLVNWAIAGSIHLTGERTEWAARLPSAVAVLALVLVVAWTGSRWMPVAQAFVAALFVLTTVSILEKGRLAEIEAIYIMLTGIALAHWLAAWVNKETGWRLWLIPGVFLGLGILAKGPTHLLFFYALVIPALVLSREKRQLVSFWHFGALAVMAFIFAVWYLPYRQATAGLNAEGVWVSQMKERVDGSGFDLGSFLMNPPRAFSNGLPWVLFAILWWKTGLFKGGESAPPLPPRLALLVRALRWPLVICFLGVLLVPGMLPRYTLPVIPVIALLAALVLPYAPAFSFKVWRIVNLCLAGLVFIGTSAGAILFTTETHERLLLVIAALCALAFLIPIRAFKLAFSIVALKAPVSSLAAGTALALCGGMFVYAFIGLPIVSRNDEVKPVGLAVNQAVPVGALLYVLDPGYQPALFYVQRKCFFVDSPHQFPETPSYVLIKSGKLEEIRSLHPSAQEVARLGTNRRKQLLVLKVAGEN